MLIQRALKIRLYPTQEQANYLNQVIGNSRFIYNQMLNERINYYNEHKENKEELYKHKYKTEKQYKEEFEFLKIGDSIALQQSRINLETAYKNFFQSVKGKRKGKSGFPKFKSKKNGGSFRTVNTNNCLKIDFENKTVKIPKCESIKFRHKKIKRHFINGKICSITVTKTPSGIYEASVLMEMEQWWKSYQEIPKIPKVIGLDMSLSEFYIDSFGKTAGFTKPYKKLEQKLAKAQRKLSRKQKGSKNREKARIGVAKVHRKISNLRKDFIEQTSAKLIKNYDVVVVETLSLKSMAMNNHGKSVSDIGYGSFISRLKTKAIENDKTVLEASKWFASTQTCNVCGFKNKETKDLSTRDWICPECKTHHDRDANSAINLKKLGLNYVLSERQEFTSVESKIPELALLALNLDVEAENFAREGKKHSDLQSL